MDLKGLIRSKKFLLSSVFVVTILILVGFVWLIYSKDEPKIIPPETRGEIREGVKEEVVKPIESVFPSVGGAIRNAAFNDGTGLATVSLTSDTANGKTYRNNEFGLELQLPEDWTVGKEDNVLAITPSGDNNTGLWIYIQPTESDAAAWWALESKKYDTKFNVAPWSVKDRTGIKAYSSEGLAETHYIVTNRGKSFDLLIVGSNPMAESVVSTIKLF